MPESAICGFQGSNALYHRSGILDYIPPFQYPYVDQRDFDCGLFSQTDLRYQRIDRSAVPKICA